MKANMRAELAKAFELLRSGDAGHLDQALGLLQKTVYSFSMTFCGQREDAEDTMQDVLLKAIPYLHKFDSPQALTSWLYTVARNRCWMSRRKSKFAPKQQLSLEELMPDAGEIDHLRELAAATPNPEHSAIALEDAEQLKKAILQLPPQYRLVLVLHDVEELSTEDISRILGLKEGNVRVRLHRARLFLRKSLAETAAKGGAQASSAKQHGRRKAMDGSHRPGRCKRIFANLSNYLDGVLDQTLCDELERHLEGCEPCKLFLASLQKTIEQTRRLPVEAAHQTTAAPLEATAPQNG
jgi:RNA polymerase sigma-70 factor (ECF subfamily)